MYEEEVVLFRDRCSPAASSEWQVLLRVFFIDVLLSVYNWIHIHSQSNEQSSWISETLSWFEYFALLIIIVTEYMESTCMPVLRYSQLRLIFEEASFISNGPVDPLSRQVNTSLNTAGTVPNTVQKGDYRVSNPIRVLAKVKSTRRASHWPCVELIKPCLFPRERDEFS